MPRSIFSRPVIPGQLKLRLDRLPVCVEKPAEDVPPTPYRLLKKSEVFGYTAGESDCASENWRTAVRRYIYRHKGDKIQRRVVKHQTANMNYARIEAGAEEHGMSLWDLRSGLAKSDVQLNKKLLAELAIFEPKTFQSLVEVARQQMSAPGAGLEQMSAPMSAPGAGLEAVLRPDLAEKGVLHRNGLVPHHTVFCQTLTHPQYTAEIKPPKQSDIPPPPGWRITGHYPGKNLYRATRHHHKQRPKLLDYKYLPYQAEAGQDAFPPNKMGKNFKYAFRRPLSDPKVYEKKPHWPQK